MANLMCIHIQTEKYGRNLIEEGIFDSDILEVKSGLSMDDMVVTTWSSELYDGAEVRLKGETTQDDSTGDCSRSTAGGSRRECTRRTGSSHDRKQGTVRRTT